MIYIRNLFTQDLRDGKQIAFPMEPSNILFKFSFSNNDPDRKIGFKFKEKDKSSSFYSLNGETINTRLYSERSESRIDGELKHFLKVNLNAKVDDIIVFRAISQVLYEFEFIPSGAVLYNGYKSVLAGKNHEVVIEQDNNELNNYNNLGGLFRESVNLKEDFAHWFIKLDGTKHNYYSDSFGSNREKFIEQISKYEEIYKEQFGTSIFTFSKNELKDFINELEQNLYASNGEFYSFSLKTSTHMPRAILGKKNYIKFLKEQLIKTKTASANSPKVEPINKIYFGAPGTGKSFQITEDLKEVDLIFQKRITFHPEYDNASFIGGYKPKTDSNGDIKYVFVPQTFTDIYVEACNDPIHQYYLIIEEINRGNCAEIFGELFQLLDRDKNYKITPSNELLDHLNNEISNSEYYIEGKMLLPDNLSIYATMNTSDQSLFPMDSAFKRRWDWEYIPINYSKDASINKSTNYNIVIDSSRKVNWIDFIYKINSKIEENTNLGMDKCIGNYFVKPNENNEISLDNFIHKVMFYLWNDVFKDEPKDSIFTNKISYQSFFPIKTEGLKQIIILLENLQLLNPKEATEETQSVG